MGGSIGKEEAADGLPFRPYSQGGAVLERATRRAGCNRDQFLLWHTIPDILPYGYPEPEAVEWGRPYLEDLIHRYKPRAILALGGIATAAVTGLTGPKLGMKHLTGFVLPSHYGIPVVPCFDPTYLRQGKMSHFGILLRSIKLAMEAAKGNILPTEPVTPERYKLYPTEEEAKDFFLACKHCTDWIAYDIETPMSDEEDEAEEHEGEILSVQFSTGEGSGIYFPYRAPFIDIARDILALDVAKLSWNGWRFDEPRLSKHNLFVNGENHDLMWAWHHLQPDLPRGLQFAAAQMGWPYPWKHHSSGQKQFYGITDVDVLQWIRPRMFNALQEKGLFRSYQRHIVALEPVLRNMSDRGIPVDPATHAKVTELVKIDQDRVFAEMQLLVPDSVKKFHPAKGYKKPPANLEGCILKPFPDGERWVRLDEWTPSNKGLIRYMTYKGHPIPRDMKTKKDTTAEIELKRLALLTKDPVYSKVVEYREAGVIIDNHLKNWTPNDDGRVHSTFYFHPATGQLSSRRPNVQNAPMHKGHAKLFNSMIKAFPGSVLINFDFKSFHAQTLAFEAQDIDYLRLAKLDIHSFLAAHLVHDPKAGQCITWPDDELRDYLAWIKAKHEFVRDYKAKRAILGYGFGMGYKKLFDMNRESFTNQTEAKRTLDMLNGLFPKAAAWREEIKMRAHEQGYLLSRHGYIRYFWEVYKFVNGSWSRGGEDSEAAIAFLPANIAFGEMRDRMMQIADKKLDIAYGLINNVHDSLVFHCPIELADQAIVEVKAILEAPSKVLVNAICPNGLSVAVGIKRGLSASTMEKA